MNHTLHPGHLLFIVDDGRDYTCNGCYLPGRGARYRCNSCNFNLHVLCARCPSQIPFSGHPHHLMTLILPPEGSPSSGASLRQCHGCLKMVEGMFYHLESGNINLHPICLIWHLQALQQLQQPQVAPHPVTVQRSIPAGHDHGRWTGLLREWPEWLRLLGLGFNVLSFFNVNISDITNAFNFE